MIIDLEREETAARLRGSLLEFIKFFFQHLNNRQFDIIAPIGRRSHIIDICEELTKITRQQNTEQCLNINVCPGSFKTTILCMWVAWCSATYPDSNFIYVSYSKSISIKATSFIKDIMSCRMYRYLFDVWIRNDSKSKQDFMTNHRGRIVGLGADGSITGVDAGTATFGTFGGALIIDDYIKVHEAASDTIRLDRNNNYQVTLRERLRSCWTPIVNIGQRAHQDDLSAFLLSGGDIYTWRHFILPSLDGADNALIPHVHSKEKLLAMREKAPYIFAAQHQQNPLPAGGALYKRNDFVILPSCPNIMHTFITVDGAETDKTYNDASAFGFFGVYEIENFGQKTGRLGLHWIDCMEIRVEPRELKPAFVDFFQQCLRFKVPPKIVAIEKKSTGVTLLSILKDELRGIQIRDIDRNIKSGSKSSRFIEIQGIIGDKLISFTDGASHTQMCIDHMIKITANNSHRFDDIADVCADAIRIALIDKTLYSIPNASENNDTVKNLNQKTMRKVNAGAARNARYSQKVFR